MIGHHVSLFIDHSQEQVRVACPVCTDDLASLCQNLLQERSVSLREIDQIDWPTQLARKLIDELDSSLWGKRGGRSHGEVQIAVNAATVCRERTKEDRDDDRWVACQDLSNRGMNRGIFFGGRVVDVMGMAHDHE